MKKLTLFFILTGPSSIAQFTTTFQPLVWYNHVVSIAEANSFYYVAGSGRNSMNGSANTVMFLTTLDANGNVYNQYYSDSSAPGAFAEMHCYDMVLAQGGFIMAGDSNNYFYVCKIDDLGNFQWSYIGGLDDTAHSILATANGYVISGDSGAISLDFYGNLLWQETSLTGDLAQLPTGIVSCTKGSLELRAVDSNGLNPWTNLIGIQQIWPPKITASSSNLYIVGNRVDSMFLTCTDLSGNLLWTKGYHGPSNRVSNIRTCNGGLMITGILNGYAYLMRTDFSGNILWQSSYQPVDCNSSGCDAMQTSDEHYFWSGTQFNNVDQIGHDFAIKAIDSLTLTIRPIRNHQESIKGPIFDLQGRELKNKLISGLYIRNNKLEFIIE